MPSVMRVSLGSAFKKLGRSSKSLASNLSVLSSRRLMVKGGTRTMRKLTVRAEDIWGVTRWADQILDPPFPTAKVEGSFVAEEGR